jgi:hypothetical protein
VLLHFKECIAAGDLASQARHEYVAQKGCSLARNVVTDEFAAKERTDSKNCFYRSSLRYASPRQG